MLKVNKPYKLGDNGHLRGLFKVGKPEYWNSRHDESIEYADDEERGYEADLRRKNRRTAELLEQAQQRVAGSSSDFSHPLFANLRAMASLLGLNETELVVLCILVLLQGDRRFNACVGHLGISVSKDIGFVQLLTHITRCASAVTRALEENPIPAIWITNHVGALDPAYRRRFDYSLHVKTPPRSVRLGIAQHHLSASQRTAQGPDVLKGTVVGGQAVQGI